METYPKGEFLLPLFPLPNLVFFPRTRLPLHVFEPRYREMVTDALAGDERIGIVLLKPGWETDYYGSPEIHQYGTMGSIEQCVSLEDGRYNLLLDGVVRFRIVEHLRSQPYRVARVVAEPETYTAEEEGMVQRVWLADLSRQYLAHLPGQSEVPEIETVSLDALTNALIMSLNLESEQKQKMLEMSRLLDRSEEVSRELETRIESLRFLASFSRPHDPNSN